MAERGEELAQGPLPRGRGRVFRLWASSYSFGSARGSWGGPGAGLPGKGEGVPGGPGRWKEWQLELLASLAGQSTRLLQRSECGWSPGTTC